MSQNKLLAQKQDLLQMKELLEAQQTQIDEFQLQKKELQKLLEIFAAGEETACSEGGQ